MPYRVHFIDVGLKDYKETWDFQQKIQSELVYAKTGDAKTEDFPGHLIFVEHPHVYTLGKSGSENNLLINPDFLAGIHATYYRTDRGGDITYHGPGQIVGYPVFDLDKLKLGIKDYIHHIEQSVILTLHEFGIETGRLDGATGVWLNDRKPGPLNRKICAIGVKVSRGITMHGFALNVNTDLNYFSYINPCGFTDKGVTSMEKEKGRKADFNAVKEILKTNLADVFGIIWDN